VRIGELYLSAPLTLDCRTTDKLYTSVVANEAMCNFGRVFLMEDSVRLYVGAVTIDCNVNFYFADWLNASNVTTVDTQTFLTEYMPKRSHWQGRLDMNMRQSMSMNTIEITLSGPKRKPSARGRKAGIRGLTSGKLVVTGTPVASSQSSKISDEPLSLNKLPPERRVGAIVALKEGGLPVGIVSSQEPEHSRAKVWGSCGKTRNYQFKDLVVVDPCSSSYKEFLRIVEEEQDLHERQVAIKAVVDAGASKDEDQVRREQLKLFKKVILDAGKSTNAKLETVSQNFSAAAADILAAVKGVTTLVEKLEAHHEKEDREKEAKNDDEVKNRGRPSTKITMAKSANKSANKHKRKTKDDNEVEEIEDGDSNATDSSSVDHNKMKRRNRSRDGSHKRPRHNRKRSRSRSRDRSRSRSRDRSHSSSRRDRSRSRSRDRSRSRSREDRSRSRSRDRSHGHGHGKRSTSDRSSRRHRKH
jgi:hypothetical protein